MALPTNQPKYTAQQMSDALRASKGMVTVAARQLKCSPQTVRNYIKRYPTVAATLHDERELATDIAELALFNAIQRGEAWAVCFYLKTQGKSRGYIERLGESRENDGQLIEFVDAIKHLRQERKAAGGTQ